MQRGSQAALVDTVKPSPARYHALLSHYAFRELVPLEQVLSRSRNPRIARIRWQAWRELRRQGFSYPGIGYVANRHHTTVMFGVSELEALTEAPDAV